MDEKALASWHMDVLRSDERTWVARPASGAVAAVLAAGALVAVAAAIGASASAPDALANSALRALMVAAPIGAAYAGERTGQPRSLVLMLLGLGALSFLTTLADTSDPALYTLGRFAGWCVEVLLVVVLLAAPTGAPTEDIDRRLASLMGAVAAVFYVPTLLLSSTLPVPNPFTSCLASCPDNPLALAATGEPLPAAYTATGGLLVFAVMAAVAMRLYHRTLAAERLHRRWLIPVALLGTLRAGLVGSALVARQVSGDAPAIQASATAIAWLTPMFSLALLVAFIGFRRVSEGALNRLASEVRRTPTLPVVETALGQALGDPSVAISLRRGPPDASTDDHAAWTDACGNPVPDPATLPATLVELVRDRHGAVIAAVSCVATKPRRPALADATAVAAMAIDNLRREDAARQAARDVRESRARIVASTDRERRRIERDLHDGAQQRLVALRIELGLVGALVHRAPGECAARLDELTGAVDDALEEIRCLAHGVCPPLLTDRGLHEALRVVASECPVPVRVEARGLRRYSPEIERAVYFCILEALQNVAKHAHATHATVLLEHRLVGHGDELRFSIRDDGAGAQPQGLKAGGGVANMHDRMAALNGDLSFTTPTGGGTTVTGRVPLPGLINHGDPA